MRGGCTGIPSPAGHPPPPAPYQPRNAPRPALTPPVSRPGRECRRWARSTGRRSTVARRQPSGPDLASPGDARVIRRSPSQLTALRRVPVGRPPPARPGGRQSGGGEVVCRTGVARPAYGVREQGGGHATMTAGYAETGPAGPGDPAPHQPRTGPLPPRTDGPPTGGLPGASHGVPPTSNLPAVSVPPTTRVARRPFTVML